jgi:hypothetical protein
MNNQDTNKKGIPVDNIMLLADTRLAAYRTAIEAMGIEIKASPMPNSSLIFFPAGWEVVQRGAKRATKGDVVFEF